MNFVKHPNLKSDILLIAIGIVGVFGSLSIIYSGANSGSQKYTYQNGYSLAEKKSQILAMVGSKDFLTQWEKESIVKELIGEKIKTYSFSQEESDKILQALNKN